jgi:hypothetical protein
MSSTGHYGTPPHRYAEESYAALVSMNAISVGTLSIFLGIVFRALRGNGASHALM